MRRQLWYEGPMRSRPLRYLLAAVSLAAAGTSRPVATEPLKVFVSIQPLAYLAERIAGEDAEVRVLVPPGKNYHTYEPTPGQVIALSASRLLFTVGVPFEKALIPRVAATMPQVRIVDATQDVTRRRMEAHVDEPRADVPPPTEENLDPHVWLAPAPLKILATNICQGLSAARPEVAQVFSNRLAGLSAEIDATDALIRRAIAPLRGRKFYVFHPAFGYFADAYGLKQEAIEMEGKSPSPRQLSDLIGHARADRVKLIVVQPEFDTRYAQAVADAIGGRLLTLNPQAKDVIATLRTICDGLVEVLGGGGNAASER